MIFVARSAVPSALDLNDADSKASKELKKAISHWEDNTAALPAKNFKAYADTAVRDELRNMFHAKCAYCESPISGSSQDDIEHYRPKGGVEENGAHPGYWWLAMQWDNLVLSCMHCNQHRRQLKLSPDMSETEIREAINTNDLKTTGKKNAFPTENNQWIVSHTNSVSNEKPLLIDPTVTDPEAAPLFTWMSNQEFALMVPVNGDVRALTTIEVLGLNRRWLCEQRMAQKIILSKHSLKIRTHLEKMLTETSDALAAARMEMIQDLLELLADMGQPNQPYAGMARDHLKQVKEMLNGVI